MVIVFRGFVFKDSAVILFIELLVNRLGLQHSLVGGHASLSFIFDFLIVKCLARVDYAEKRHHTHRFTVKYCVYLDKLG